jgi:hypothetical protein
LRIPIGGWRTSAATRRARGSMRRRAIAARFSRRCPWGALIRSSCESTGFGTRPSSCARPVPAPLLLATVFEPAVARAARVRARLTRWKHALGSALAARATDRRCVTVAFLLGHFDVRDYDAWKQMFDSDPAGRKEAAKGHIISRGVDNPSDVFVRVEFASVDEAKSFRERLLGSGALNNVDVKTQPTVVEVADEATY